MAKILIVENEFASIKDPIDALMEMFQGQLRYDLVSVSQDIKWNEIEQYSAIFVDVSLSPRTELDGYGILSKIKEQYPSGNYSAIIALCLLVWDSHPADRLQSRIGVRVSSFVGFSRDILLQVSDYL